MYASFLDAAIFVTIVPIGACWGASGVAIAISVASTLSLPARTFYACRNSPIAFMQVVRTVQPVLTATIASTCAAMLLRRTRIISGVEGILIDLPVFLLTMIAFLAITSDGRNLLSDLHKTLKTKAKL